MLGGIFNKIALEGFYSVQSCRAAVTSYFTQYSPRSKAYGFVPVMSFDSSEDEDEGGGEDEGKDKSGGEEGVVSSTVLETFMNSVDVRAIVLDALSVQVKSCT